MRKLVSLILCICFAIIPFTAFAAQKDSYNLKLGSIWDDSDPSTAAINKFSDLLKEKTNGKINVRVFNNSQLGNITDMLTGMKAGTIEMLHTRISTYGFLEGASMFNICSAPFIWDNNSELEAFLQTDTAKKWFDQAAKSTGVRVFLAKGETEARQLSSNKPIRNANDFKGLKIRTAESAVVQQTMKTLGAQPVVIPFNDLYMALRQNTVDAQENGFITIKNKSFFEVQKYLMKTDYIRDISIFCISEALWQSMSEDIKAKMIEAAKEAADTGSKLTNEQVDQALNFLKTKMQYLDIDTKSIQEKLSNVYEDFDGKAWAKGSYPAVKAFKDSKKTVKK